MEVYDRRAVRGSINIYTDADVRLSRDVPRISAEHAFAVNGINSLSLRSRRLRRLARTNESKLESIVVAASAIVKFRFGNVVTVDEILFIDATL